MLFYEISLLTRRLFVIFLVCLLALKDSSYKNWNFVERKNNDLPSKKDFELILTSVYHYYNHLVSQYYLNPGKQFFLLAKLLFRTDESFGRKQKFATNPFCVIGSRRSYWAHQTVTMFRNVLYPWKLASM